MIKIIYFLIACNTCDLERMYFNFDRTKYENCTEQADVIREQISSYYSSTDVKDQGWYTPNGKLVIGYKCE
jgi:hypothetical protein